jgi:hypothetical protein
LIPTICNFCNSMYQNIWCIEIALKASSRSAHCTEVLLNIESKIRNRRKKGRKRSKTSKRAKISAPKCNHTSKVQRLRRQAPHNQVFESFPNYFYIPNHLTPFFITLLSLPRIPPQLPTDTINPVFTPPSMRHDIGKRVSTRTDSNVISGSQLYPFSTVKTRPAACSRIIGNTDSKHDGVRQDDRTEGESVCADGGDEDHRVFGVAERTTSCEVVGC